MNNKELESILLSECDEKLNRMDIFFETDYKGTLKEMFDIFFEKVKRGPSIDVQIILNNIETILLRQDSSYSHLIISAVRRVVYEFSKLKVHDNIELRNIRFQLLDINRKIKINKEKSDNDNLYNLYHSIIFKEKDLNVFELILKQGNNVLSKKDSKGNDIFYNILDYYSTLEEDNISEIDYFHDVIMLFLKLQEDILVKNAKNYYFLLERDFCKNKKHVIDMSRQLYGFNHVDIIELRKKYDISTKIHDDVIKEINGFSLNRNGRTLVNSNFVTIDDEDASCLDDAISMVENKDGSYTYYVAITDIPSIVPYHSRTFYDALRKNETLYLCDRTIPLYPPCISNELCSLLPGIVKNAIIYKFDVDPYFNLDIDSLEIIKGIIRVNKKLSYGQVNRQENISLEDCKMIENMYFLVSKLKRLNSKKDNYRKLENLMRSDATYHHSLFSDKSISANIVQESMLLVNSAAPRYFSNNGFIYNYRNHKFPKDKEISRDIDALLKFGKDEINSAKYIELLNHLKEMYFNAYYSIENNGHEGLGYDFYSHSTSAARRFSDTFNQYLTYFQIFDGIQSDREYYELEATAREIINHINERKLQNSKFEGEYNYLMSKIKTLKR